MKENAEVLDEVFNMYYDSIKINKTIEHENTIEANDTLGWDIYAVLNTPYRLYITVEIYTTDNIEYLRIELGVAGDPDVENTSEFSENSFNDINSHIIDGLSVYDLFLEETNTREKIVKKLDEIYKKQMKALETHSSSLFLDMEKEASSHNSLTKLQKDHAWVLFDWIEMDKTIALSKLDIRTIPNLLNIFDLDTDERFVTDEVKDIFLF